MGIRVGVPWRGFAFTKLFQDDLPRLKEKTMKSRNIASALLISALSFCSINAAFAQTSGIPSPIDGQPITG